MTPSALLITYVVPTHDREGAARHGLHCLESLQDAGWSTTLVAESAEPADAGRLHELRSMGVEAFAGPNATDVRSERLEDWETLLMGSRFDLAIIQFWNLAERWLPRLAARSPDTAVVVDSIDVHLLRLVREHLSGREGPVRMLDGDIGSPIAGELNVYGSVDAVLAVSQVEADLIDLLVGRTQLGWHVPLWRAPAAAIPRVGDRRGMVFLGFYGHPPNVGAARTLAEDVVPVMDPAVRAAHPLRLIGSGLNADIAAQIGTSAGVEPVGWVPHLSTELERARVMLAPLGNGAGVKNKVLDALACGLPVVTNAVGAEGLPDAGGEGVWLAETPREFATAAEALLTDDALWTERSNAGLAWIAEHASQQRSVERLMAAVDHALARHGERRPAGYSA